MAYPTILIETCKSLVERCDALGLKGKKADNEAVTYFCGVYTGLRLAGKEEDAAYIGRMVAIVIAVRGMSEVRRILAEAAKEPAAA